MDRHNIHEMAVYLASLMVVKALCSSLAGIYNLDARRGKKSPILLHGPCFATHTHLVNFLVKCKITNVRSGWVLSSGICLVFDKLTKVASANSADNKI
jgi:hypothetical protein